MNLNLDALVFWDEIPTPDVAKTPRCPQDVSAAFASRLRENPNKWAVWPGSRTCSSSSLRAMASAINRGVVPAPLALRDGTFRAAARGSLLYVRYVGGDPA